MKHVAVEHLNQYSYVQTVYVRKDSELLNITHVPEIGTMGGVVAIFLSETEESEYCHYEILSVTAHGGITNREKYRYVNSIIVDGVLKHFFLRLVP